MVLQTHTIEEIGAGTTKTGAAYRWLKLDGKKVSFFHAPDLALAVKVGDRVQYDLEQSGNYWNGKDLKLATALGEPAGDLTTVLERIAAALERIAAFFDRK